MYATFGRSVQDDTKWNSAHGRYLGDVTGASSTHQSKSTRRGGSAADRKRAADTPHPPSLFRTAPPCIACKQAGWSRPPTNRRSAAPGPAASSRAPPGVPSPRLSDWEVNPNWRARAPRRSAAGSARIHRALAARAWPSLPGLCWNGSGQRPARAHALHVTSAAAQDRRGGRGRGGQGGSQGPGGPSQRHGGPVRPAWPRWCRAAPTRRRRRPGRRHAGHGPREALAPDHCANARAVAARPPMAPVSCGLLVPTSFGQQLPPRGCRRQQDQEVFLRRQPWRS